MPFGCAGACAWYGAACCEHRFRLAQQQLALLVAVEVAPQQAGHICLCRPEALRREKGLNAEVNGRIGRDAIRLKHVEAVGFRENLRQLRDQDALAIKQHNAAMEFTRCLERGFAAGS